MRVPAGPTGGSGALIAKLAPDGMVWLPALTPLFRLAFDLFAANSPAAPVATAAASGPFSTHLYIAGGAVLSSVGCILGENGR